ncbi:MAG: DUF983 domain-containing protein [Alphaproteobacteria bacterium]|nr:DUF983 domain-containing protein [Alphaproteobacteria bacterium SS10]
MPGPRPHEPVWWQAGLACRCPACGHGQIFEGFLKVRDACSECGFELGKHDSGDGPAFFVLFLLCAVIAPLALIVNSIMPMPVWLIGLVWGVVIILSTLALLRPAFGLMIGVQYRSRATGSDWALPPEEERKAQADKKTETSTDA